MPGTRPRSSLPDDWKPYVYRGSVREPAVRVLTGPGRGDWGRLPSTWGPSCGKPAGWWSHRRRGEKACEACREAHNAPRRKGTPLGRPRRSECGSEAGYRRHLSESTDVCGKCREAVNAVNRERYAVARCKGCGYLRTAAGHRAECGGTS